MLKESLPKFVYQMQPLKKLLDAEQKELDQLEKRALDAYAEFHINSAKEHIRIFEEIYQTDWKLGDTVEQRRALLMAKRNMSQLVNEKRICETVDAILCFTSTQVIYLPDDNLMRVYIGTNIIIRDLEIVDRTIFEMRPAHIAYELIESLRREYILENYAGIVSHVVKTYECEVEE